MSEQPREPVKTEGASFASASESLRKVMPENRATGKTVKAGWNFSRVAIIHAVGSICLLFGALGAYKAMPEKADVIFAGLVPAVLAIAQSAIHLKTDQRKTQIGKE